WAGLMPLTEFEYEKAARGIALPVSGEYAWGTTQISNSVYILTNPNQNSEIVSNASVTLGNANNFNTYPNSPYSGPLRNGIFATATSSRITSGGGFYGVMDLSGNLSERLVPWNIPVPYNAPNPLQNLSDAGYAFLNSPNFAWPGINSSNFAIDGTLNFNTSSGLIYRGGAWNDGIIRLELSDRGGFYPNSTETNRTTMNNVGIRGCVIIP
ncbi:MAG: hypothetical protein ACOYKE_09255, partial [Ferruginibacter sp.]